MSISSLPYDVVDEILTGISYEEIKTLKAASLVCRSWSESAQKRIFAELRMGCYPNAHPYSRGRHRRHIDHVCDVLSTDVNRASLVKRFILEPSARRLGLSGLETEDDDEREQFDREDDTAVWSYDYGKPFIEQFEGQIVTILKSLDRLEHLEIDFQVHRVSDSSGKGSLPLFIPALRRTLSLLPTLSSFSMRSGGFDTVDDMAEIFLDGCHIQHLEICNMMFPSSAEEAYTRQPFLGFRAKLRSLVLGGLYNEGDGLCDIPGTFVDWLGSKASAFDLGHLLELNESKPDVRRMDQHRLVALLRQTSASLAHYTGRLPIEPLEEPFPSALLSLHIRENERHMYNRHDNFINPIHTLVAFLAHPASRKLETLTVEAGRHQSHLHHDSFPFQDLPIWTDLDSAICFSPYADKLREVKIMKHTCDRPECLRQQSIKQDQSVDTWYFADVDPAGRFSQCMERGIRVLRGMKCQTCIRGQQKLD